MKASRMRRFLRKTCQHKYIRINHEWVPFGVYFGATDEKFGTTGSSLEFKPKSGNLVSSTEAQDGEPQGKDKNWADMDEMEQLCVQELAWTASSWDAGDTAPFQTPWSELSEDQQSGAHMLGLREVDFE